MLLPHCRFEGFSTGGLIESERGLPGRGQHHIAISTRTMEAVLLLACCSMDTWLCVCRTDHPAGKAVPGILAWLHLHRVLCIQPGPTLPCLCHTNVSVTAVNGSFPDSSVMISQLWLSGSVGRTFTSSGGNCKVVGKLPLLGAWGTSGVPRCDKRI